MAQESKRKNYNISKTEPVDFSVPLDTIDTTVLHGKTAIVTGGANGIGFACAKALSERKCFVAMLDMNEGAGQATEAELKDKGLKVKFIKCDVSNWESQLSAFKEVLKLSDGQLDIVMPCAGVGGNEARKSMLPPGDIPGGDPPEPSIQTLEVNLVGVYYSTILAGHYFLTLAPQKKDPSFNPQLLYVSSLAGYMGMPGILDYVGSKWGVRGLFKALRVTLDTPNEHPLSRPNRIGMQINLMAPTYLKTDMTKTIASTLESLGCRMGTVEDAAAAMLRCVCDPKVSGRAVAIAQGFKVPGDANFDLEDDLPDGDAAPTYYNAVQGGVFGALMNFG